MTVRYLDEAERELLNEIAWLESRAVGLGGRLLAEVLRAEEHVARYPQAAREVRPGIHRHVLRTFRYSLYYSLESEHLLVLAFAHQHRRPDYWVSRLDS